MADTYAADEPEGSGKSAYMSKGEMGKIFIVLAILIAILLPVYRHYRDEGERSLCKRNFQDVFKASTLYLAEWNDRYPPLYVVEPGESEAPFLDSKNRPYTWGSLLANYVRTPAKENPNEPGMIHAFQCPSAYADEIVWAQDPRTGKVGLPMTTGMSAALAVQPNSRIKNPNSVVLFAETSNHGARDTYNPVPLKRNDGATVPYDGFLIGFDTSNVEALPGTRWATRLAFYGSGKGYFGPNALARHPDGNHFMFASGQLGRMPAGAAKVEMLGDQPTGMWEEP